MEPPIDPPRPTVLDPTYARPEPWFVGSGTGLMIAVLAIVAALLVVRGVTTVMLVEEALAWWQRTAANAPTPQVAPPPVERAIVPLPVPRVPPPDRRLASRGLRGTPKSVFSAEDYPAQALRAGAQGRTVAVLEVAANGAPSRCMIQTSSGSPDLDRRTCQIAVARVRFEPARDERGVAIASRYPLRVRWVIAES